MRDKPSKVLYRIIYTLCGIEDNDVLELNVHSDHVHLIVIVPPKISISAMMGHLKGHKAIRLYNRFPHIMKNLWGNYFWSPGYFINTEGYMNRALDNMCGIIRKRTNAQTHK
jgi:putative transposase